MFSELEEPKRRQKGEIVTVLMGLGHFRAAHALLPLFGNRMRLCGSRKGTPEKEYRLWKKARRLYYRFSRAGNLPVVGRFLKQILTHVEQIEPYYPIKDLSQPTWPVHILHRMIDRKGLGRHLVDSLDHDRTPTIHTFYATSIALDLLSPRDNNYLLVTDSDFNRVWVPKEPARSRIQYLAPCTQVKRRLISYGVLPERIHLTGFPLPTNNIGDPETLGTLKADLCQRLSRLDPQNRFITFHEPSLVHWLGKTPRREGPASKRFTLTFAIGGAGAQVEMISPMLTSLSPALKENRIRLFVSAGISITVYERILAAVNRLSLDRLLGDGIQIIFHDNPSEYCDIFNKMLRQTDVLWTKPSELSFYSALGIPILLAPSIGPHESLNKKWLREVHAAVSPPGDVASCSQWLFDLLDTGRLAEAAWDGFLKGRKLGSFKIHDLICHGRLPDQNLDHPLNF